MNQYDYSNAETVILCNFGEQYFHFYTMDRQLIQKLQRLPGVIQRAFNGREGTFHVPKKYILKDK